MNERPVAMTIEMMARKAENLRWRCLASALSAAAARGKAGMSQRYLRRGSISEGSAFHRSDFIHVDRFVMPINGNDEGEADGGLGGSNADRENHEHNAGEGFRMRGIPPERDEVKVGRVKHQFDADEDQDAVAAC